MFRSEPDGEDNAGSVRAVEDGRSEGRSLGAPGRVLGIGLAALLLALSTGVAYAVFGSLTFVELERDGVGGVEGLNGAEDVATSPDGAHVYVVGSNDDAVAVFARDQATGALSFVEFEMDGVGGVDGIDDPRGVTVSPDGAHVYVTGIIDDAVATFSRSPVTGALSFVDVDRDGVGGVDGLNGATGVAVSPDNLHVYVTGRGDDAVATFSRSPATGALSFVEFDQDGIGGVDGLDGADDLAASLDGAHVYVASNVDDAVATFSRNAGTGALSFVAQVKDGVGGVDGLDGAEGVATSPSGTHVYATGFADDAVATFSRNAATGALSFVELDRDGVGGVDGLDVAVGVATSLDGAHVYVGGGGDDALVTFSRDATTGALSFVELDQDGVEGVDGLSSPGGIAASPDGSHLYVAGISDDSVATFAREGPPAGVCKGKPATIVGTSGPDVLSGTPNRDVMVGLGGNDKLSGLAGNDLLCGGKGADTLLGGKGRDTLLGQTGNDKLRGGKGGDTLLGDKGRDTLLGQTGNDKLRGGKGRDRLLGGKGRDRLLGQSGNDRLNGGRGRDTCIAGKGKDSASGCEKERSLS
jgi:6-phosphogluconolactonase (cycloisomerase 2 family)